MANRARCMCTDGWLGDRPGATVTQGVAVSRTGSLCQSAAERWLMVEPRTALIAATALLTATSSRLANGELPAGSAPMYMPRRTRRIRPTVIA